MKTVAHILAEKPDRSVHTVDLNATVYEALRRMADENIGALVVVSRGEVAGIVSERDYARKVVLMSRTSKDTPVRDVMSSPVMYVTARQSVDECMALMTENRLRHLPVLEDGRLVGLVSIGDLVKAMISEQQFIIEQLEHYITGER